jgi:hypothetical protein
MRFAFAGRSGAPELNCFGLIYRSTTVAKLLLLIGLAVVGWLVFRLLRRPGSGTGTPPEAPPESEAMVTCARCGVAIPRGESVERDGRRVCRDSAQCRPGS